MSPAQITKSAQLIVQHLGKGHRLKKPDLLRYIDLHLDSWGVDLGDLYLEDVVDQVFSLLVMEKSKRVSERQKSRPVENEEDRLLRKAQKAYDRLLRQAEKTIPVALMGEVGMIEKESNSTDSLTEARVTDVADVVEDHNAATLKEEWTEIMERVDAIYSRFESFQDE